jgi:hypothetical protein
MARMAVSSANVAMVVVGEVGRSAVYMRYSNGPRTLPWGTPAWTGDRVRCVEAILTKKCIVVMAKFESCDGLKMEEYVSCDCRLYDDLSRRDKSNDES